MFVTTAAAAAKGRRDWMRNQGLLFAFASSVDPCISKPLIMFYKEDVWSAAPSIRR
jgi:hypothetical protein